MSNQPMPGARSLWTVTTKLRPVRMEEKPTTKAAAIMKTTFQWPSSVMVEYGV